MSTVKYINQLYKLSKVQQPLLTQQFSRLEPVLSSTTLYVFQAHILKSHVDRLNTIVDEFKHNPSFDLIDEYNYNLSAYKNMVLFLDSLSSFGGRIPTTGLIHGAVTDQWGCFQTMMYEFTKRTTNIPMNGWGFLSYLDGKININTLPDHETIEDETILLAINGWDYAYNYDYGDDKRSYLKQIWRIVDWDKVEQRLKKSIQ